MQIWEWFISKNITFVVEILNIGGGMNRILIAFLLLLCPICAIGQKPDTVIVKYSDQGKDTWYPEQYHTVYRPYIVAHYSGNRRSAQSVVDTVIGGYRVGVSDLGRSERRYACRYRVCVSPVDTTQIEWWRVGCTVKSERMRGDMRRSGIFNGRYISRHNEVVRRMESLMGLTKWTQESWLQFVVGRRGVVRSYTFMLDSAAYHKIATADFVRLIDTLNTNTPFIGWQELFPEDTLPAVHYENILPRYLYK